MKLFQRNSRKQVVDGPALHTKIQTLPPNLVQLMPSPMLSHLSAQDRKALPPIVASGFVCNKGDVFEALKKGAVAVSASDSELWNLDPDR